MARPTGFKRSGGGFLNGVDGVIQSYKFTDEFNGEPFKEGKVKGADGKLKERFHSLFCLLTILVDGADEPITQNFFAGGYDDFDVSEDGQVLTPLEDGNGIREDSPFGKFIVSLVEAADTSGIELDTTEFYSDSTEDPISFATICGRRVRFGQQVEMGRDGKPRKRIAKKGKFAGKEFDSTTTVVEADYGVAEVVSKKGGKAAVAGKKGKAAPVEEEMSVEEAAPLAVLRYLESAKDGSLAVSKLKMKVLTDPEFKGNSELRDAVIQWVLSAENLKSIDDAEYNKKTGTISLPQD